MTKNYRAKFFDSVLVSSLIREAAGSDSAAKRLLLIAAEYIREGEPLPTDLRQYMASAIETAVNNPAKCDPYNKDTGAALLIGLNLKRSNRPLSGIDPYAVCAFMFNEMVAVDGAPERVAIDGVELDISASSQSEAARSAAIFFDISESTAKRYFKQHIEEYIKQSTAEAPDKEEVLWLARMQES